MTMIVVHSVREEPCPSCADDVSAPCDRCDGGRVIAVIDPPRTTQQQLADALAKVREMRRKVEGT